MSLQPTGFPRFQIDINDMSTFVGTALKGIIGFCGITEWGPVNDPQVIGSWAEYRKKFGGLRSDTQFPLICKRALEAGARLKISRTAHYTTIAVASSLVGVKAEDTVQATSVAAIVTANTTTDYFEIAGDFTEFFTAGRTFVVAGSTGNDATYTVISSSFITSNTRIMVAAVPSAVADGNITYVDEEVVFRAKSIGPWANTVTVTPVAAASGNPLLIDITISNSNYPDLDVFVKDFPLQPTPVEVANFNARYDYVDLVSYLGTIPVAVATLAGGAQVIGAITDVDYIGDIASATGIHSFDNDIECTRIAVPEMAMNTIDVALADYAAGRKDIFAILRTPIGLDGATIVDYREQTGTYAGGTAIDTYLAMMFTGGLKVKDELTGLDVEISELGDVAGSMSRTDNNLFEWFSFAGLQRGVIKKSNGVVYNLGTPARALLADTVYNRGVNAVIDHAGGKTVVWGNRTMQRESTYLQKANIAQLLVFLQRSLPSLVAMEQFNPNDPITWQAIYQRVKKLCDYIADNRGFIGKEGIGWRYEGDQNVNNVTEAIVNSQNDIAAGLYKFKLYVKATPAMEWLGVEVNLSDSSVDLSVIQEQ